MGRAIHFQLTFFPTNTPQNVIMTARHTPPSGPSLPVASEILQVLSAFSQQTSLIFDDLSRPAHQQSSASSSSDTLRALEACAALDEQLGALLYKAEVHVRNQNRIRTLENELVEHELRWREEVEMLEQERKELKTLVDSGKKARASIEQAGKGKCSVVIEARLIHLMRQLELMRLLTVRSRSSTRNYPQLRPSSRTLHLRSSTASVPKQRPLQASCRSRPPVRGCPALSDGRSHAPWKARVRRGCGYRRD